MNVSPKHKKETIFVEHASKITAIAFNSETGIGATADDRNYLKLWELSSGEILYEIDLDSPLSFLDFSRDGRYLAAIEQCESGFTIRVSSSFSKMCCKNHHSS